MKSLEAQALSKIVVFKNKTLLEILELTEDGNNPQSTIYNNVLFKSRETLFTLFDMYMTVDVRAEEVLRFQKERRQWRQSLQDRHDVQTSSECKNFFIALARGFMWNYMIVMPSIMGGNVLGVAVPKGGRSRYKHQTQYYKWKIKGLLPESNCIGIGFSIEVIFDPKTEAGSEIRHTKFKTIVWDERHDWGSEINFRYSMAHSMLTFAYQAIFTLANKSDVDPISNLDLYALLELEDLGNDQEDMVFVQTNAEKFRDWRGTEFISALGDSGFDFMRPDGEDYEPRITLTLCEDSEFRASGITVYIHIAPFTIQ